MGVMLAVLLQYGAEREEPSLAARLGLWGGVVLGVCAALIRG